MFYSIYFSCISKRQLKRCEHKNNFGRVKQFFNNFFSVVRFCAVKKRPEKFVAFHYENDTFLFSSLNILSFTKFHIFCSSVNERKFS
jgi:hypothetical protein